MILQDERQQIADYGRKLINDGLTTGTGGNLSLFNRELGLFAIKPSGMEYAEITSKDVVVMDLHGRIVDGDRKPSSEVGMHRILYEKRLDINGVVHTHSPNATALSCLGLPLPAIHYLIAFSGSHEVPCTPYVPFGTPELAQLAWDFLGKGYGVLLGNHGLLTAGPTLDYAYSATEELEFCCELYLKTLALGGGKILSKEDIAVVLEKFSTYGQKVRG